MENKFDCGIKEKGWNENLPLLFRVTPKTIFLIIIGFLVIAWVMFIAIDILKLVSFNIDGRPVELWNRLFNNHPVEWSQWFLLVYTIVTSAYIAGRLLKDNSRLKISSFFLIFSIGLGLMLIEEAGDIRHTISYYVELLFGEKILGLPYRVVSDVPYFALLASVPLYAMLRYGRSIWGFYKTRNYLIIGVFLYGFTAISNGIRHLGDFYIVVGRWVDRVIFLNRFPVPDGMTQARAHFMIVDSVIEETIETLAITFILAGVLAFANQMCQLKTMKKSNEGLTPVDHNDSN